jgi:UDP-3-O-[3-hydroxymyristoyl] glucosamine N-acyltransferase
VTADPCAPRPPRSLGSVASEIGAVVRRDAEFRSLGYLGHRLPRVRMLAFLEHERFLPRVASQPDLGAVLTTDALADRVPQGLGVLVHSRPGPAFYALHNHLAVATDFYWDDFPSEIHPSARVHPRAHVAERNVRLGRDCVVEPGAVVLGRTIAGDGVRIRAGSVIAADGMELKRVDGAVVRLEHAGGVRLGDRVEVHANAVVVRAVFGGFTEIGDDTVVGSLVNVAHGVRIGRRCFLPDTCMLAGAVTVGDDVVIDPNATIAHELHLGDGCRITLGAVVTKDVPAGQKVSGNFAIPHDRFLRFIRSIR